MWFILYFACLCFIFWQYRRKPQNYRRLQLMELINTHKIYQIEWRHRGRIHKMMLTSKSVAKASRNRRIGIQETNGIIVRYFWLEGKLCNTDSFDMKHLRFNRP